MTDFALTADLYDQHQEALACCDTQFRQFGGRRQFQGSVVTVSSHEDNALLKKIVDEPGDGRVIVVDGGGSVHCAMLGDNMAARAASNGWAGIIINGAVRDAQALASIDLGIKALGTNPRRSHKHGAGAVNVTIAFGGAVFAPGCVVASDDDGLVVLPSEQVHAVHHAAE